MNFLAENFLLFLFKIDFKFLGLSKLKKISLSLLLDSLIF